MGNQSTAVSAVVDPHPTIVAVAHQVTSAWPDVRLYTATHPPVAAGRGETYTSINSICINQPNMQVHHVPKPQHCNAPRTCRSSFTHRGYAHVVIQAVHNFPSVALSD
jgi:hypothetical protein